VFTICEEVGLLGAKHLDVSGLTSRAGLVLDSDAPGYLFTRAPAANHLEFVVHGLEAHAGMAPERGINAIQVAAEGVAAMRLGRIDASTTANIGVISGGGATNVVPNLVRLQGEARSHDEAKLDAQCTHMQHALEAAAAHHTLVLDGREVRARVESTIERSYDAMAVPDAAPIVQLVCARPRRSAMPSRARRWAGDAMPTSSTAAASRSPTSGPACATFTPSRSGCG